MRVISGEVVVSKQLLVQATEAEYWMRAAERAAFKQTLGEPLESWEQELLDRIPEQDEDRWDEDR